MMSVKETTRDMLTIMLTTLHHVLINFVTNPEYPLKLIAGFHICKVA